MRILHHAAQALFRNLASRSPRWFCRLKMLPNHSLERDQKFWDLYAGMLRERTVVQPLEDFFNVYQLVLSTRKLPGDLAEVGVYRGGSAKLIASLKGDK